MSTLWLALALLAIDGGGGPRFEGSVAAGGGFDGAALVAPGSGAASSAVGTVSAAGGAVILVGDDVLLHVAATLDGARFASLAELDRAAAGATATVLVDLADSLALSFGASTGYAWYADPTRSGASFAGRASVRWRPLPRLTVRAGYAHVLRAATDPVFSSEVDRLFGELELRLGEETYVALGGAGERGDGTFYAEVPGADGAASFTPYRAPATTLGASLGLELGLGAGLYLETTATLRRTWTPEGAVTGPAGDVVLGWRWN